MRRSKASAASTSPRERGGGFGPRPKQRAGDERRWQQKKHLAGGEERRVQDVVEPATHRCGAVLGIGKRQEVGVEQPDHMRQRDQERERECKPRPGRGQSAPRLAVEQHEERIGRRQHDDKIFRPQRTAKGDAEERPMTEPSALERRMKAIAGQRPERQLDDVVIEFHRRVLEIMHAVDNEHGDERAGCADERPRRGKDQGKGDDDRGLRQGVIGGVHPKAAVHDLDQPPRQRRQLVGTERPFAAVGQGLDEIERQVGVKQAR